MSQFDLVKGERVNITKASGGASDFYVGLSWDVPQGGSNTFDLDVSVFGCKYDANDDPKLVSNKYFVFYNNLSSGDGAIEHSGDNRTGDGAGDDEQIRIHINKLDPSVREISIIADIYQAAQKGQNFGQVKKGKIRICTLNPDGSPGAELAVFKLSDDYSAFTAVQPGSLYQRDDGDWAFNPTGAGFEGGLAAATKLYTA